ncbi:hypothetical protein HDU83_002966 [Entophlyctis luteolus]|nr:hypothetical protein HDU83_002966 [Entophlyctis luteolus]
MSGDLPLPPELAAPGVVSFDCDSFDFARPVHRILREGLRKDGDDTGSLGALRAGGEVFLDMRVRRALQACVAASSDLGAVYRSLIASVVAPHLWDALLAHSRAALAVAILGADGVSRRAFPVVFQFPPTLRVHPARCSLFKRAHTDAEYGHQVGEVNFWMPLTSTAAVGSPTMEIMASSLDPRVFATGMWHEREGHSNDADSSQEPEYLPVRLAPGSIQRFHGQSVLHRVPPNNSDTTRVSLDFRVAPRLCFDYNRASDPKLKIVHGYEELTYFPIE